MSELAWVAVLAAGFVAGLVNAMVGGGGLVQLPALLAALPAAPHASLLGTNKLASTIGAAGSVWRFARSVDIPWRVIGPASAIAFAASLAGAATMARVPPDVFRPLVPILLAVALAWTLSSRDLGERHAPRRLGRRDFAVGALAVAGIGFYDGFFGPGTGSFLVLLLIRLGGFDFLHAAASARVLNLASNAAALAWLGGHGHVLWAVGLLLAAANTAGALLGTRLAVRHGSGLVRRVFVVAVAALIVKTGWDAVAVWRAG